MSFETAMVIENFIGNYHIKIKFQIQYYLLPLYINTAN